MIVKEFVCPEVDMTKEQIAQEVLRFAEEGLSVVSGGGVYNLDRATKELWTHITITSAVFEFPNGDTLSIFWNQKTEKKS